jgi:hypothetical protein
MAPKWRFVIEINGSINEMGEGAQTVVLSHQTKWLKWERGGYFGVSPPCWLLGCQMSKYPTGYHHDYEHSVGVAKSCR